MVSIGLPTAHDLLVYPLILSNAEGVLVTNLPDLLISKTLGSFPLRCWPYTDAAPWRLGWFKALWLWVPERNGVWGRASLGKDLCFPLSFPPQVEHRKGKKKKEEFGGTIHTWTAQTCLEKSDLDRGCGVGIWWLVRRASNEAFLFKNREVP